MLSLPKDIILFGDKSSTESPLYNVMITNINNDK